MRTFIKNISNTRDNYTKITIKRKNGKTKTTSNEITIEENKNKTRIEYTLDSQVFQGERWIFKLAPHFLFAVAEKCILYIL